MQYEKIWKKVLGTDEAVAFEFSVGKRYRMVLLIIWGFLSILFLPLGGVGILMFLIALFYYGFYMRVANAYAFTNKRVLIHRGWLSTRTTSIDYTKITDIHVEEPFFDRIITHTGNLKINTAGTTLAEVVLNHVEHPYEIKKELDRLKD
jgi:uncharacterized membrane protein YdbT with pleckstrin-like domain